MTASRPDVVVHAAAWTDVDGCEEDPERAMAVNAQGSRWVAQAAADAGSALLYISTDAVFDGEKGGYVETDQPAPVNVYGRSKLAGEDEVLSVHPRPLVVRVPLEGWRPGGRPGFVQWVAERLSQAVPTTICTDWIRNPVFAANLASVLEEMHERELSGIYHVGASAPASNYEIALMTAGVFGFDASFLVPISGDDLKLRANRPKNTSLDTRKLETVIRGKVWGIREGITAMRSEQENGCLAELRALVSDG